MGGYGDKHDGSTAATTEINLRKHDLAMSSYRRSTLKLQEDLRQPLPSTFTKQGKNQRLGFERSSKCVHTKFKLGQNPFWPPNQLSKYQTFEPIIFKEGSSSRGQHKRFIGENDGSN